MPRRKNTSSTNGEELVPQLNHLGSKQAYLDLIRRALAKNLDFGGHPTGVFQLGNKLFLYEDIGVGRVCPRVVTKVRPLRARDYLPRTA